jgi:RNA polymerase sigma-70 factor (ECF subfamily)
MHESPNVGAVLSQHEAVLKTIAKRLCGDAAEASDLVQDTFERALRAASTQALANPRAWLVTIMHNLFIDRCRQRRRQPFMVPMGDQVDATPFEPEPEPEWATISMDQLRSALARLEDGFRRVYELHCFEGASYDEIAQTLNIAKNTVGTRLARARQKLRELLRAQAASDDDTSAEDYVHAV